MKIERMPVGAIQTNCYILVNEENSEAVVVDPGNCADSIVRRLEELQVSCSVILLTHGHFDHILAVREVSEATGARIWAGADEAALLADSEMNVSMRIHRPVEVHPDRLLRDGERISPAGIGMKVIFTPGHTHGSVCYYIENESVLLSGDTLFESSVGRTDLPTGNETELYMSITGKLFSLPGNTRVLPGHGEATAIERESKFFGN